MRLSDDQAKSIAKVLRENNIVSIYNTSNTVGDFGENWIIKGINVFLCYAYGYADIVGIDKNSIERIHKFIDEMGEKRVE